MEIMEFKNSLGETLKGIHFANKDANKRVFIFEGMEEHSSRYSDFASFLNKNGYDVYCIDVFGQGENVSKNFSNRGIWPKGAFNKYVDFANDVICEMNKDKKPTYIFSHSMGSFMGQAFIQRHPNAVEKIVLCGSGSKNPALGVGLFLAKLTTSEKNRNKKSKLLASMMFGGFNKKIDNPKTDYDWLSVNEENIKKYINDPLCGYGPNKGFCLEFMKGMRPIHSKKELSKLNKNTKIFIISGEFDPVTKYSKSVKILTEMYLKSDVKFVSSKIYKGKRHEILNDFDKEIVYQDIVDFFNN